MEQRIVQALLLASAALFVLSVGLAAVARPVADLFIIAAGRGSAALLVTSLVVLAAFKEAAPKRVG